MSGARNLALRIALVALSTGATLLAAEWMVRVLLPQFNPSQQLRFERHGDLVLGPPNTTSRQSDNAGDYDVTVHFGPRGFRDPRDVAAAQPGDILVVGDSFAFGWGVEENERFSNQLESLLHRRVFNIGIPGQDLDGYARLMDYAHKLGASADEVVLALCVENDIGPYQREPQAEAAAPPDGSGLTALLKRSALRQLAAAGVRRTTWLENLAVRVGVVQPTVQGSGGLSFTDADIAATTDRAAALARGHRTTVLIVPSRGLWLESSRTSERALHNKLLAALRARGLEVADPSAAFEASGAPLAMHFAKEPHWNAHGHAVAAQVLATSITQARASDGAAATLNQTVRPN